MHSVDFGITGNTAGKILDGKYSSAGKLSPYMSIFVTAL